jgi:hypothetical protein
MNAIKMMGHENLWNLGITTFLTGIACSLLSSLTNKTPLALAFNMLVPKKFALALPGTKTGSCFSTSNNSNILATIFTWLIFCSGSSSPVNLGTFPRAKGEIQLLAWLPAFKAGWSCQELTTRRIHMAP